MSKKGKNIEEFGSLLGKKMQLGQKIQTHWAIVEQVDWQKKMMDVKTVADDLPFYTISLGLGSFYRRPKTGSLCLIGLVENQDATAFLIDCEAFEEAVWKSKQSLFRITQDGFVVQQGEESLKEVLNDWQTEFGKLCDELNKVVVSVGVSPNVLVITHIKQKVLNDIKNRLNTILIE